ncbi:MULTISPECIES: phage tail protein [unclassified Streptomyces]|uniref:phage tail protein n=1 Tax=unclassified Streptomyces TaxID=2593676 RepID=UPI001F48BA63|nr:MULTISPECIES: phage tail protein [unclassified Streptomyces]MCF0087170.1 hypothetical protein [Streptomyces sp. MH192]MCF0098992.1 hypothetical protein [Streptomyces sp. MH191]
MLPISEAALRALPAARRPVSAEWSNDGGQTWIPAQVGSGEVRPDRTAECRYSGTAELLGVPLGRSGVNTQSTRVRLRQGIVVPRRGPEWIPAGTYLVDGLTRTRLGASVDLLGLEDAIRGAKLPRPRTIGPDTARAVLPDLVAEALPGSSVAWRRGVDPDTLVPQIVADEDRWALVSGGSDAAGGNTGIASAMGGEFFVDANGVPTVTPMPTLSDPVVWRIPYGMATVEPAEQESADGLVNCWVVTGDGGDGQPVVGPVYVWDDDPQSVTYAGPDPVEDPLAPQRLGLPWVRLRVDRYTSALITTAEQAHTVGRAKLANSLGIQASLSFTSICNPALEPGDVVDVEIRPGEWQRHVIESCPYTLGSATQSCTTRTTSRRLQ